MAALAPTRSGGTADEAPVPGVPPGRRSPRPRWRDGRLLAGVLLLLVSVAVGARVVTSAARSDAWVSTRVDLPAGHVLTEADLGRVEARLDATASRRYFRVGSGNALVGRPLVRPTGAGNLLPQDAIAYAPTPPTRVVPVVVKAGRLPALQPGDAVDVYVLTKDSSGAEREQLVVAGVEFLAGDTLGSGDTAAQLRVAVPDAIAVVAASESERVDLVRVDGAPTPLASSTAPSTSTPSAQPTAAPGFGGGP